MSEVRRTCGSIFFFFSFWHKSKNQLQEKEPKHNHLGRTNTKPRGHQEIIPICFLNGPLEIIKHQIISLAPSNLHDTTSQEHVVTSLESMITNCTPNATHKGVLYWVMLF